MKKERGSILIITLTTVLFMLAFLISTYTIIANRRQAQAEIRKESKEIYEKDIENIDEIYSGFFADENAQIPIYEADQLFQIATDNYILSGNKIYYCSGEKQYKLMQDIEFNVENNINDYPESFNETTSKWIDIEDMVREGKLTGEFNYNGNVIKETDLDGNLIIHKVRPPADILGEGTEENPYVIYSIEALIKFADNVKNEKTYSGEYVILGDNLDFESEDSYNDPERTDFGVYGYNGLLIDNLKTEGFAPIGADINNLEARGGGFYGIFDGKGKTIKNLKLKQGNLALGLFAVNKGTIKNLCVENAKLETTNANGAKAILCAYNESGVIDRCWVSGNITTQSPNGHISIGGLVGQNIQTGTIQNCYSKANIQVETEATDTEFIIETGGIVAKSLSPAIIQNCYNLGNILVTQNATGGTNGENTYLAGCVGYFSGTVTNCYNLGQIKGSRPNSEPYVGGVVGTLVTGTIENSCNSGTVLYEGLSNKYVGTLVGAANGTVITCYSLSNSELNGIGRNYTGVDEPTKYDTIAEMPTVLSIVGGDFIEDTKNVNNGYPILKY